MAKRESFFPLFGAPLVNAEHIIVSFTLQWVDQIGGHEKLGEKLLKQKKGDKLPTFIPPKVISPSSLTVLA